MNQHKKNFITVVILTLLVAIPVSLYFYSTTVYAAISNTKIAPQPERFTELYIDNHTQLTKATDINQQNNFSFTIRNLEYKTMTYPYEVYVEDTQGNRSDILKSSVTLKHNEKQTIPAAFVMVEPVERARVVVNLINKNQKIHYWIGEKNETN